MVDTGADAAVAAGAADDDARAAARPLRADAERNRRLVLDVAARVFAERGLGATLNDIAREAGVGVGTVYRRFADKEALVEALFERKFATLVDLARAADDAPSAGEGLRAFLWGAFELRAGDRGLAQLLAAEAPGAEANASRELLHGLVGGLIDRARAEGSVREDLAASDVPMFMLMVGAVADGTRDVAPETWRRYARLVVDGLVPDAAREPLPRPPLGVAEVFRAMQRTPA